MTAIKPSPSRLRGVRPVASLLLLLVLVACSGGHAGDSPPASPVPSQELRVRRGDFRQRFLLTGELEAVKAASIGVPQTPLGEVTIRWMETEGTTVAAGQKVLEFDNSAFAGDLEEKRLAMTQAESELERARADASAQTTDREFALERSRVALEKAKSDAAVPEELLKKKTHRERVLALRRAEFEFDKAKDDLDSYRESSRADLETKRIALEKARREIRTAEDAIQALTLRAPRAGILVVGEKWWEGRKWEIGDAVWPGLSVMSIPDLSAMRVAASLSDVDDGRIALGMPARVVMDTYPDLEFAGRITEVTPVAQEQTRLSLRRAFHVAVELDKTDPERMRPGMSVKVEVETLRSPGVLLAPRSALDLSSNPPRAFLRSGGEAQVRLGACNPDECVVDGGVSEGDRLRPRG